MKKYIILMLLPVLAACAKMVPNSLFVENSPVTQPTSTNQDLINQIVANQNVYRNALGQESLINGLTCNLYTVPTTTTAIIGASLTSVGSFEYVGDFNQPNVPVSEGLNILPTEIESFYTQWYILECSGDLVVVNDQFNEFSLSSDDGANLYIDGGLLVNNDGLHAVQTVSAAKFLEAGVHTFQLNYLQGAGYEALILNMNGNLLPSANLYH